MLHANEHYLLMLFCQQSVVNCFCLKHAKDIDKFGYNAS